MQTVTFNTSGDGYWSRTAKAVEIVDMQLGYVADDKDFGELCVYFNTSTWDVNTDGLIYTDSNFIQDLYAFLTAHGLSTDVSYSEQGMQGDNYVSLDVTGGFIASWEAKFGEVCLTT
jgi:hypothetical protein